MAAIDLIPYLPNATEKQVALLHAIDKYGSPTTAARELGREDSWCRRSYRDMKRMAAARGWSPEYDYTRPVPEGFLAKGVSTYYNAEGEVTGQWVKSVLDPNLEDICKHIRDSFLADLKGKSKIIKKPKSTNKDIMVAYCMGDPHCGMRAWDKEAGENFDLKIWERDLFSAMNNLIQDTEPSEEAVIINVGDMLHSDNLENRTARHGHALDVDGRWGKVLHTAIMALRFLVETALAKHKVVRLINTVGNHDDQSAVALNLALQMYFENNKRVIVEDNFSRFHHLVFGKNLLAVTHGDTVKIPQLESLMSAKWPKAWGETEHRYWIVGHLHSKDVKEFRGCEVQQLRTLAGTDAWHASQGYISKREMIANTYHREWGKIRENICSLSLARASS